MKRLIGITMILLLMGMITFAGGMMAKPGGIMMRDNTEMMELERDYRLLSILDYAGFSSEELMEIADLTEKTIDEMETITEKTEKDLKEAVELMKKGNADMAKTVYESIQARREEIPELLKEYGEQFKGILTVQQAERIREYVVDSKLTPRPVARGTLQESAAGQSRFGSKPVKKQLPQGRVDKAGKGKRNMPDLEQIPEKAREKLREITGRTMNKDAQKISGFDVSQFLMMQLLNEETPDLLREFAQSQ